MDSKITTPILLIAFNRPKTTYHVFAKIREAKPNKLYVAVDGPRQGEDSDNELVNEVKSIVQMVDWTCEKHFRFNQMNLGAEVTVSSAISWVLETEEYVIVLEDDIIAPLAFFKFAQEMLIKYKDHPQIATVTGSNFTPIPVADNSDYFFAKYGHSGGWATWKRAWEGFELNVEIPEEHLKLSFLRTLTNTKTEAKYFQKLFKRMKKKGAGNSTWDFVGLYRHRLKNSLSIIPIVNLTSNIGVYGLHASGITQNHFRPVDENFKINNHPERIECNIEYDIHHFKTYIFKRNPFIKRVVNKMQRVLKFRKFSS